ncbi:MAG TPA: hypothetical protein VKQ72_14625 [Aggregatilineales bacterium]|nr:hypothetical protein [Aggregatilineales bacterium]
MLELLTTITIQDAIARYKVVLLSPRSRRRNALLAEMIGAPDSYYYALSPSCNSIASFLEGLVEALREESPRFGQQIEQALSSRKLKIADMAQAMAADLIGLKPSPSLLILSELDTLPFDEDVSAFFVHLLKALPQETRLVINARELPLDPWAALVRSGGAVVLGESASVIIGFLSIRLLFAPIEIWYQLPPHYTNRECVFSTVTRI